MINTIALGRSTLIATSKIYKTNNRFLTMDNFNPSNSHLENDLNSLVPGKIKLTEFEIKEREKKLRILAEKWKKERIEIEEYEKKTFGFSKNSEILNGRMAMFFLFTGLLTEYWTKQNFIDQVETILRTLGFL
jgi:hypothetical protein